MNIPGGREEGEHTRGQGGGWTYQGAGRRVDIPGDREEGGHTRGQGGGWTYQGAGRRGLLILPVGRIVCYE